MALPLIMAGIGAGSAALGAWQSHRAGKQAQRGMNAMADDAQRRFDQSQGQANESRGLWQSAVQGFDPQAYMREAAGAAYGDISQAHRAANAQRQVGLNQRGLFASDLGGARTQRHFDDQLAQRLSGLAMQAGQMEQQRQGMMGQIYGADQNQGNMFFDAATGLRSSGIAQRAQAGQDMASGLGQIGGAMIGAGMGGMGRPAAQTGGWVPPVIKRPDLEWKPPTIGWRG
jgi:hypothetical protein